MILRTRLGKGMLALRILKFQKRASEEKITQDNIFLMAELASGIGVVQFELKLKGIGRKPGSSRLASMSDCWSAGRRHSDEGHWYLNNSLARQ